MQRQSALLLLLSGLALGACGSGSPDTRDGSTSPPPTVPPPVQTPGYKVSVAVSPQPDYSNRYVDRANIIDGLRMVPSGVVFVTGMDGRRRTIIFPSLFFQDPQLPAFELLQNDQQTYELTRFLPVTMGTSRAWAAIDPGASSKKQYVVVDHGPEYASGYETWPFGHVWTLTDSGNGFEAKQVSTVPGFYHSVTVLDVDRDGREDIVASNMGVKAGGIRRSIHLFRQQSNGDFVQDADFMPAINFDGTGAMGNGDLDGDGTAEIVQANYLSDGGPNDWGGLRIWRRSSGAQYVPAVTLPRDGLFQLMGATQLVTVDYDADGDLDLLVSLEGQTPDDQSQRYTGHGVELYRNDGSLRFTRVTGAVFSPNYWSSRRMSYRELAITDFNLDGRPDIFLQLNGGLLDFDGTINLGQAMLINTGGTRYTALDGNAQLKVSLPLGNASRGPLYLRYISNAGDTNHLFGMLADGRPFTITVRYSL